MHKYYSGLLCALLLLPAAGRCAVPPHAVVFIYHRFGDDRYPSTNIRLDQFEAQLNWLAQNHYQVWPLPKIVRYLQENKPMPDHVVAITIDDAFQSAYVNAYPRLKARGWPFTVFVSTSAVDEHLPDFMSWDELREMAKHGANFGDHTVDHAHLPFRYKGETDMIWADRVRKDILQAQARIQAELGPDTNESPKLFAYPYGEYDKDLAELVNGLGFVAFGQEAGALDEPLDPRALPRYPIEEHYGDLPSFILKAQSLPMPIISLKPWNPLVTMNNPPSLAVTLKPGVIPADALHCYLNGPPMTVHWLNTSKTQFSLQAGQPVGVGRSRYNCTALVGGRYYWYSHMWLLPPAPPAKS
ncbi:MAG: polysaccharide deacetylase family protein [Gammaproteobacteria bacterium]|nr:polysaccharide deacetylase family protein [Gammaproteobacteria bacterium]MDE2346823.1 polysaccharide deacetylase family protein [Gammaproteobacteria bacterium]